MVTEQVFNTFFMMIHIRLILNVLNKRWLLSRSLWLFIISFLPWYVLHKRLLEAINRFIILCYLWYQKRLTSHTINCSITVKKNMFVTVEASSGMTVNVIILLVQFNTKSLLIKYLKLIVYLSNVSLWLILSIIFTEVINHNNVTWLQSICLFQYFYHFNAFDLYVHKTFYIDQLWL